MLSRHQFGSVVKVVQIRPPGAFILSIIIIILINSAYVLLFHTFVPDDRSFMIIFGLTIGFVLTWHVECNHIFVHEKGISIPVADQTLLTLGSRTVLEFDSIENIIIDDDVIELVRRNDRYLIEKRWMSSKSFMTISLTLSSVHAGSRYPYE